MGAQAFRAPGHQARLLPREPQGQQARRLSRLGALVDVGGNDAVGRDADLTEQIKPSRTGAGEDQDGGPSAAI
jgi:hypothetical protein